MDATCHECGEPQSVWMGARCSNPEKSNSCAETFCFKCLSQKYPQLYGSVFKGLWWMCPVCTGLCKCDICSDPVKKAEYQRMAKRKLKQKQKAIAIEDNKPKLRSAKPKIQAPPPVITAAEIASINFADDGPDNGWVCSRCSILNSLEDIECLACGGHRKRTTRKRSAQESLHEGKPTAAVEFPNSTYKGRATENNEDKTTPVKGRVSALRQLVKRPWADGWELGRKLALDLVEEARQQAIKQGLPVDEVRQLPTKFQLANNRNTHVRKWFDREPTLAKKFLRAAGLICSKSNGTFIREGIRSLDDMPALIRKVDPTKLGEVSSESGDEGVEQSVSSLEDSPSPVSYQPKVKVYYHHSAEASPTDTDPFVFKVPVSDLNNIDELHSRLNDLLLEMGTQPCEKKLILRVAYDNPQMATDECRSLEDLTRGSLLHVHAQ